MIISSVSVKVFNIHNHALKYNTFSLVFDHDSHSFKDTKNTRWLHDLFSELI